MTSLQSKNFKPGTEDAPGKGWRLGSDDFLQAESSPATTGDLMSWPQALEAMRQGHAVRRKSESYRKLVGSSGGVPIWDCGTEPIRLAAAWTAGDKPVQVFQGAETRVLFVPGTEHTSATDWEVSE